MVDSRLRGNDGKGSAGFSDMHIKFPVFLDTGLRRYVSSDPAGLLLCAVGQLLEDGGPFGRTASSEAGSVDNYAVRVNGYFRGLLGHSKVPNHVSR